MYHYYVLFAKLISGMRKLPKLRWFAFKCLSNESMDTKYSPRKLIEEKCRFTVNLTSVAATSDGCCAGFFASSRRFMHDAGRRTQHFEEIDHLHPTRALQIAISLTAHTELIQRLEFSKSFCKSHAEQQSFQIFRKTVLQTVIVIVGSL